MGKELAANFGAFAWLKILTFPTIPTPHVDSVHKVGADHRPHKADEAHPVVALIPYLCTFPSVNEKLTQTVSPKASI